MIDDCEIQNETFSRERQQNAARRTCSVIKMSALCRRKRATSEEVPLSTRAQDASLDGKDPVNPARTESVSRLWRLQSLLPTSPLLSSLESWGEGWVLLGDDNPSSLPHLTSPLLYNSFALLSSHLSLSSVPCHLSSSPVLSSPTSLPSCSLSPLLYISLSCLTILSPSQFHSSEWSHVPPVLVHLSGRLRSK